MADNTTLNTGTGGDVIATDDIAGVKFQRVKVAIGADGVNDGDVSSTNPLPVSNSELPAADALTDGAANPTTTTVGAANLVWNGSTWDRLDGANAFDTSANTTLSGALPVKQIPFKTSAVLSSALNSTSSVNTNGSSTVTLSFNGTNTGTVVIEGTGDNVNWSFVEAFDIFADQWVTGQSITPTAGKVYSILAGGLRQVRVRVNSVTNTNVTHFWTVDNTQEFIAGIDTGAAPHNFGYTLFHKDAEYSTTQTGTAFWTPASGKKFVVTDLTISTGGTTSGIVTLWQGASADTTYTVGTDPAIFRGEFAPSATVKPGMVKSFNVPYISTTVDHILRVTTSAAMTIYVQVNGYEI